MEKQVFCLNCNEEVTYELIEQMKETKNLKEGRPVTYQRVVPICNQCGQMLSGIEVVDFENLKRLDAAIR